MSDSNQDRRNDILKSITDAYIYIEKTKAPSVIAVQSDISCREMWGRIMSSRIDAMPTDRGNK